MKRIVICADGTWNKVEVDEEGTLLSTNVAKLAALVKTGNVFQPAGGAERQICRYLEGVGTGDDDQVSGGLFGWGLTANVRAAYEFLCENFEPGDEIFLFGFSRGAYTARSIAGLIGNSGIVADPSERNIDAAMRLYRDKSSATKADSVKSRIFRNEFSHESKVKFVGVWDTVGALGSPLIRHEIAKTLGWDWNFHNTQMGKGIENAYHAMAIHERRSKFKPTLWTGSELPSDCFEQVWFSGVHSDIGGGYRNHPEFSEVTLKWMIGKAMDKGLVLIPDWENIDFEGGSSLSNLSVLHVSNRNDSFTGATTLPDSLLRAKAAITRKPVPEPRLFRSGRKRTDGSGEEEGHPNEKIHPSVCEQYGKDPSKEHWPAGFRKVLEGIEEKDSSDLISMD